MFKDNEEQFCTAVTLLTDVSYRLDTIQEFLVTRSLYCKQISLFLAKWRLTPAFSFGLSPKWNRFWAYGTAARSRNKIS